MRLSNSTLIIAKHISARYWIADCGPGIGSCMFVCMSVTLLGMQLRLSTCAMATLFVPQVMHVFVCVRLYACAALALQLGLIL